MVKPDFDYERCIVGIRVNGEISGTGFVIGPGKILTCAHVVANERGEPAHDARIDVIFVTDESRPDATAGGTIPTWGPAADAQQVKIDPKYFRRWDEHDIAVLSWDGPLPPGVQVTRLSSESELSGRTFRTRGFPNLGDHSNLPGTGQITGRAPRANGITEWSLSSQEVTGGFSGAPLFDSQTGQVLGIARAVARPDENSRLMKTAFAVTCESIRTVCGDLFAALDRESERKHKEAMDRLRDKLVEILVSCPQARQSLVQMLGLRIHASRVKEQARVVANKLVNQSSVDALSGEFIELLKRFAEADDDRARETVSAVYLAIVSAILHPEMVRQLRQQLDQGQSRLLVLCDSRSVNELIMAGIDGRIGAYRTWRDDPETEFRGAMELDSFVEEGIMEPGKVNVSILLEVMRDRLNLPRSIRLTALPRFINEHLRSHIEHRHQRYYFVCADLDGSEIDPALVDEMSRLFPPLALIYVGDPEDDTITELQARASNVMYDAHFKPPQKTL